MLFAGIGLIASCGKKATPEDEVRNYGKYFVEKLSANQLDSLIDTYPDLSLADSIVPLQSDTIIIAESTPGNYEVTLMDGVALKVNRNDDGKITVTESRGLFAFPADKVEVAKKTGMANDSISDIALANRMKDNDFFEFINKQIEEKKNSLLSYNKKLTITKSPAYMLDTGSGYYTVTNNTDKDIKGSDYNMIFKYTYLGMGITSSSTRSETGKDIPAKGSVRIPKNYTGHDFVEFKGIKINIPEEELLSNYIPFTGKEYQEYLDSKK